MAAGHMLGRDGHKRDGGEAIEFSKLAGGGNDFVVIDNRRRDVADGAALAKIVCTRRLSVGADGLILIETSARARLKMIYFNPDGSRAFCGNGTRCAARFAFLNVIAPRRMTIETDAGVLPAEVLENGEVTLTMPAPTDFVSERALTTPEGSTIEGCSITVGVPHYIVPVQRDLWSRDLGVVGPAIRNHPDLKPEGANADFVLVRDRGSIEIRTWERGVEAETLSCGSGVMAAVAALALRGEVDSAVSVLTRSGVRYRVELDRAGEGTIKSIRFTGDARLIYRSCFTADTLSGFDAEWVRNPTPVGPRA
jgi:diaminopimelate epimerase